MKGQTLVEYIIIIGVMIMVLYAMGPAFKRGVQSMVKATSDQLAPQENADQDFHYDTSHLDTMTSAIKTNNQRSVNEFNYTTTTAVAETTDTATTTVTNMGFQ